MAENQSKINFPIVLTVASSDSGGGAGVQADLKTFAALRVYGVSAISGLTAQNTTSVTLFETVSSQMLTTQLEAIFSDFPVNVIKVGLIGSPQNILALIEFIKELKDPPKLIVDPVMISAAGYEFLNEDSITALEKLLPFSYLTTPNINEAEKLSLLSLNSPGNIKRAADIIFNRFKPKNILIKGGHAAGADSKDYLFMEDGSYQVFALERIKTNSDHGTGCSLSSGIAAFLAHKLSLPEAVERAKLYVHGAIADGMELGAGRGPLNHFYEFYSYNRPETLMPGPIDQGFPPPLCCQDLGETIVKPKSIALTKTKETRSYFQYLAKVRQTNPLVLCITNFVTVTDCANALLAIGASPVMSLGPDDARDLAAQAQALVINIGTINDATYEVMLQAGLGANWAKVPIVLDPVGVGASLNRMTPSKELINKLSPRVIRGNASEILALYNVSLSMTQRGVDTALGLNFKDIEEAAVKISQATGAIVAVTGETDLVTFGGRLETISGGNILLTCITGSGCLLSALVGAFVGANPDSPLEATVAALELLKAAGEIAASKLSDPLALGEFHFRLLDALAMS
ncbi:MAG: hydroxyethylthiazole kinase [Deltaproteobacteria bacterium]|jgi:hydroxymethylpyrimidine/phosphomethylpyrimidine kinase|nr:hydroxyethylthiazole kinase [Deltaproteobacteria bacterium]